MKLNSVKICFLGFLTISKKSKKSKMSFWKLAARKLNGLVNSQTATDIAQNQAVNEMSTLVAQGIDYMQNKLGGGRGGHVRFYYDYNGGGSILNVVARHIVGGVASQLKDEAVSQYKKLIGGKKFDSAEYTDGAQITSAQLKKQEEEQKKYGSLYGMHAIDEWGNECYDAVMLGIPVGDGYTQHSMSLGNKNNLTVNKDNKSLHPVWYDTTALVTVSSDKDLILTRVTGRDYSRKELVSNGDMMFSVSGHITSGMPDIYPSNEVQKFRTMMEYKGILDVNNEIFDQWGVKKIVIRSFNLPPTEGNKSTQDYSFECVGIQPETDAVVKEDTITIIDKTIADETDKNGQTSWSDVLKDQLDTLKENSVELVEQGAALATGLLDELMTIHKD